MRRLLMLMVASTALVLAGCGDDGKIESKGASATTAAPDGAGDAGESKGSGGSSADVDALASDLMDADMGVERADAECVATAMVDGLSSEGLAIVQKDETDMSDLTGADKDVLIGAFNDCVDMSVLAGPSISAFAESSGVELTDEEQTCAADALAEEIGGAGNFLELSMSEDQDTAETFVEVVGGCVSTDTLVAFMTKNFSSGGSMTEPVASCIAQALVGEFGGTDLLKGFVASADGSMPADLESAVTTAATSCAAGG